MNDLRHIHESVQRRQLATCLLLIYQFAFRIGDASQDVRARGLTSLQVHHVRLKRGSAFVAFDFLGKDNVPFRRALHIPSPKIRNNLAAFIKGKQPDDIVMDRVTPDLFNAFMVLQTGGRNFTAKDLRTCRANIEYETSLLRHGDLVRANADVAFLCNHRSGPRAEANDVRVAKMLAEGLTQDAIRVGGLSLMTSLKNYIDPRIPLAFCARERLPRRAAYASAHLRKKFSWA